MKMRVGLVVAGLLAAPVTGQEIPWVEYRDPLTGEICSVINAGNAQFAVLDGSWTLVLISSTDRVMTGSYVDSNADVYFGEQPFGQIVFDTDIDGQPTLWWATLTGRVMEIDELTGEPFAGTQFPDEIPSGYCDVCDFWDDQAACAPPPEEPEEDANSDFGTQLLDDFLDAAVGGGSGEDTAGAPAVIPLCGAGVPTGLAMSVAGVVGLCGIGRLRSRRGLTGDDGPG
jgi:hypothetical protein